MATFVPTEVGVHDVFVAARGSPDGSDESQEGALIEKSYQTRICNAKVNNIIQGGNLILTTRSVHAVDCNTNALV